MRLYLKGFDRHAGFVLLLHHLDHLGHDLVCHIVGVSPTLPYEKRTIKQSKGCIQISVH